MPTPDSLRSLDGTVLHATFFPGIEPRAVLVVSHGLGEHSACYDRFAEELAATPGLVSLLTFDYRGHGLSPGKRGVVRDYQDYVADLDAAIARAAILAPALPLYVFGHSNGGQVAIHEALARPDRLAGLILSNPSLRVSAPVPRHKYLVGLFLRWFAPNVTLDSTVTDEALTRDPISIAQRKADTLRHGKISAPLFFGMVEGGRAVLARAPEIRLPLLIILGEADPVVDPATTRGFFDRLASEDKTLRVFPDMLHEPLNEIGREEVVEAIIGWLSAHLAATATAMS